MEPGVVTPDQLLVAPEKTAANWAEWAPKLVGKKIYMNVAQETQPPAPLQPGAAVPAIPMMIFEIASTPIGVGGNCVVFRGNPIINDDIEKRYVIRYCPGAPAVEEKTEIVAAARRRLQYEAKRRGLRHLVPLYGHNKIGTDTVELLQEYQPLIKFLNINRYRERMLSLSPGDKKPLIASMMKSLATSCHELQLCAPVFSQSLQSISKVPEVSVLVHGDIKVENLMLDTWSKTLRLGDFDGLAIMQPGQSTQVTSVTSRLYAPLEFAIAGEISDKVDPWMISTTVVRMFSRDTDFNLLLKRPWTNVLVANALGLSENDEIVVALLDCHAFDPMKRRTIDHILAVVQAADTDMFARTLLSWRENYHPEERDLALASLFGDATMMQAIGAHQPSPAEVREAREAERDTLSGASIVQTAQSIVAIQQNQQQKIDQVVDQMISEMSSAGRVEILRGAVATTAAKAEMASAVLQRFIISFFFLQDGSLNASRINAANAAIKSTFAGSVGQLDLAALQLASSTANGEFLVGLGRLFTRNQAEPTHKFQLVRNYATVSRDEGAHHLRRASMQ
eukprot:TRINITY_DN2037_c0_g1_i2.p1 TRINITY_DN2037_c0_g1~~TRINITY_DN2037_c0_g1_i2.p1  ORF type:complete len:565 (+),score=101.96 TRINITY_DN2037_c0_g1_i2:544-2238(+)